MRNKCERSQLKSPFVLIVLGVPAVVAVVHEYRHAEAVYAGQTTFGHVFQLPLSKLHSVYSGLRVA
jgi:hypothetical protein